MGVLGTKKVKPDKSMRRGDVYYTTGRDKFGDGIILLHPDSLKYYNDENLYEVHIARKVRVNVNATITEIK